MLFADPSASPGDRMGFGTAELIRCRIDVFAGMVIVHFVPQIVLEYGAPRWILTIDLSGRNGLLYTG